MIRVRDVQVLCPMNRGGLRARALNAALQSFGNSTNATSTQSDDDNVVDAEVREAT